MRDVIQLVRVKHGSHLYGTTTPTSDVDFKGVHIPSGRNILLGRAEDVITRDVVSKIEGTDKNDADAVDEQSYSVQKFFDMLMKGDTVATEILFTPIPIEFFSEDWWNVQQLGKKLLNRQCKGFVGYCVRQAAKYGIKGSRMAAVKKLVDYLNVAFQEHKGQKLYAIESELHALSAGQEHMEWENIPSPNGVELWHINCCDRKMPMSASIVEAYNVYKKVWDNYGERARAAMTNEGIDWKAVSHAVRVAHQAIELLDTGKITFPRPEATYLLEIKQGQVPYSQVSGELEALVAAVQLCSEQSNLPETSDRALADEMVLRLYQEQVHG